MILKINLSDLKSVQDILNIQKASYLIEANLIQFYDIPTLKDTIESIQECEETFYGFYKDQVLAGFISYKITDHNVLDIHRVAVHPAYFRQGIAQKLLDYIEKINSNIERIIVCTGKDNGPAVNLYQKNGFIKTGDMEIGNGVYLSRFEKQMKN